MKFRQIFLIFIAVDFIIALAGGTGAALVCGVVFVLVWFIYGEIKRLNPPKGRKQNQEQQKRRKKSRIAVEQSSNSVACCVQEQPSP